MASLPTHPYVESALVYPSARPGQTYSGPASPPLPVVSLLRNADNHAFLEWPTTRGFKYVLERSSDLNTWTTTNTFYGGGQTISTRIYTAPPATPQTPVPPPPFPVYDFFVMRLEGTSPVQSLVSWTHNQQNYKVIVQHDFEIPGMPILLWSAIVDTDPANKNIL